MRALVLLAVTALGCTPASAFVARLVPPVMTAAEAWDWVRSMLDPKDAADLRVTDEDAVLKQLLAWAPTDAPITIYDRACRPLELVRSKEVLTGDIHAHTSTEGRTKEVAGDTIWVGRHVILSGYDQTYERGKDGKWVLTGGRGRFCTRSDGRLSKVTNTEAWWGAESGRVTVECNGYDGHRQRCADGSERVCKTCDRLTLVFRGDPDYECRPLSGGSLTGMVSRISSPAPVMQPDCTLPCSHDTFADKIAAANEALQHVSFTLGGREKHPSLFRSRAACRSYKKQHIIPKDQLERW